MNNHFSTIGAGIIIALAFAVGNAWSTTIQTEIPIMNPSSTENMWAYYYDDYVSYISSDGYVDDIEDVYQNAVFQGYVTSDNGPWVGSNTDSWGSGGASDANSPTVHAFETYITSNMDKTIYFRAAGDDGYSIFIDDIFLHGGTYWDGPTFSPTFDLTAGTQYKLTYIGSNQGEDPFGWHFKMYFNDGTWSGRVQNAPGITMDASPVPIPSTILLMGAALIGMGNKIVRKKK